MRKQSKNNQTHFLPFYDIKTVRACPTNLSSDTFFLKATPLTPKKAIVYVIPINLRTTNKRRKKACRRRSLNFDDFSIENQNLVLYQMKKVYHLIQSNLQTILRLKNTIFLLKRSTNKWFLKNQKEHTSTSLNAI